MTDILGASAKTDSPHEAGETQKVMAPHGPTIVRF